MAPDLWSTSWERTHHRNIHTYISTPGSLAHTLSRMSNTPGTARLLALSALRRVPRGGAGVRETGGKGLEDTNSAGSPTGTPGAGHSPDLLTLPEPFSHYNFFSRSRIPGPLVPVGSRIKPFLSPRAGPENQPLVLLQYPRVCSQGTSLQATKHVEAICSQGYM